MKERVGEDSELQHSAPILDGGGGLSYMPNDIYLVLYIIFPVVCTRLGNACPGR